MLYLRRPRGSKFLQARGIALWEVLESCERIGSSDSAIKNEQPNDLPGFLSRHPQIRHVFFDSKAAQRFYLKYHPPLAGIEYGLLPSPSPTYASMAFEQKLEQWKAVRKAACPHLPPQKANKTEQDASLHNEEFNQQKNTMKALILLGTLKENGTSNTAALADFAAAYMGKEKIDCEIIRLAEHEIGRGTYIRMEKPDGFPAIYKKILDADIVLFATPIWWNSHSSEIQRVIERLDEVYDIINEGKPSPLEGKLGGVIITGDSDGVEHVTGNIANFFCSLGLTVPAYASLGVIWEGHGKQKKQTKSSLTRYYEKEYASDAASMAQSFARLGGLTK